VKAAQVDEKGSKMAVIITMGQFDETHSDISVWERGSLAAVADRRGLRLLFIPVAVVKARFERRCDRVGGRAFVT